MREPLQQLLFPEPTTSSSVSLLSTQPIDRPIDMIITDMFVHTFIQNACERGIITHVFFPCSFAVISMIMCIATGKICGPMSPDFASALLEAYSFADGFICHSIEKLDERAIDDLRQRALPCSNLPIRFVAPLMLETFSNKENVRYFNRKFRFMLLVTISI